MPIACTIASAASSARLFIAGDATSTDIRTPTSGLAIFYAAKTAGK